jgi:hypothetical protein
MLQIDTPYKDRKEEALCNQIVFGNKLQLSTEALA